MTDAGTIKEILDLYRKHSWALRRVLLSDGLEAALGDSAAGLFGTAQVTRAEMDAAWFSRRSRPGEEAWELRRLGGSAFALVVVLADDMDEEERRELFADTEARLAARAKPAGN